MKTFFCTVRLLAILAITALPALTAQARITATATNAAPAKTEATGTNSTRETNMTAEITIPLALFELAEKPTRDPFFPLSVRSPVPLATNAAPAFSAGDFTLKGLSGSAGNRLALINNRTLSAGESTVLNTPSGKLNIHCLEIRESSVLIRVDAQAAPVELYLRKAAQ